MDIQLIVGIINESLVGVGLTDEQKNTLVGLYFVSLYKSLIDVYISLRSNDSAFLMALSNSLTSMTKSLSEVEKKEFNRLFEKEKTRLLIEVLDQFKNNLTDEETKKKIDTNIENIAKKLPNNT